MSDIHICPTCNARARQVRDADSGELRLKAIQDDEAAAKCAQRARALLRGPQQLQCDRIYRIN